MVEVFVSELPGAPSLSDVSAERLHADGLRCGHSCFQDKNGDSIDIQHHLPPIRPSAWAGTVSWSDVAQQTVSISAWFGEQRIGGLRLKRYNAAQGRMLHSHVWSAASIDVVPEYRRCGIGSAMFQHARTQGFQLGPSHKLRGSGKELWEHLDPTIHFGTNGMSSHPIGQTPRIPLPQNELYNEALARLADFYRPNPTLANALITSPHRLLQDNPLRYMFHELEQMAPGVICDPKDLLRRVALLVSRSNGGESVVRQSFHRWRFGRLRHDQISIWHRYRLTPWQRRLDFIGKATEVTTRMRSLVDEDTKRFQPCPDCRGGVIE